MCCKLYIPATISVVAVLLCLTGCSPALVKPKGRIVEKGAPLQLNKGESLQLSIHQMKDGKVWDSFGAKLSPDNAFEVEGRLGKGVSPGQYRFSVEITAGRSDRDRLNGAFSPSKSPIIRDITSDKEEIVIDVAKPSG